MAGLLLLSSGCYDESLIFEQLEDHERRILALEKLCAQMNTNITSMQTILTALQNNDFVTDVAAIKEDGKVIGYTITFSKSGPVTIYHGKDGADGKDGQDGKDGTDGKDGQDGKDGYSPVLGVKQHTDGVWYWTLDGEWLLDEQGNKVKASGTDGRDGRDGQDGTDGKDGQDGENGQDGKDGSDGVTPLLTITEGNWYISYDNGETWTLLGVATGADGKDGADGQNGTDGKNGTDGRDGTSFFKSVTQEGYSLIMVLADNTTITLPMRRPLSVEYTPSVKRKEDKIITPSGTIYRPTDTLMVQANQQFTIDYLITSDAPAVQVELTTSPDVSAYKQADPDNQLAGSIHVEMGSSVGAFSALNVFVSDGMTLLIKKFYFKKED